MTPFAIVLLVAIAMGCVASALRYSRGRPHGSWYLLAFVPAAVAGMGQGAVFVTSLRDLGYIPRSILWASILLSNSSFLFGILVAATVRGRRKKPVDRRG